MPKTTPLVEGLGFDYVQVGNWAPFRQAKLTCETRLKIYQSMNSTSNKEIFAHHNATTEVGVSKCINQLMSMLLICFWKPWLMIFNKTHNIFFATISWRFENLGLVVINTLIRIIRNWLVIIAFVVNCFSHPYLQWNVLNKGWYKMEIFFFGEVWMNYGLWWLFCAKKETWITVLRLSSIHTYTSECFLVGYVEMWLISTIG